MIDTKDATDVKDIDWKIWKADKHAVITYIFKEVGDFIIVIINPFVINFFHLLPLFIC